MLTKSESVCSKLLELGTRANRASFSDLNGLECLQPLSRERPVACGLAHTQVARYTEHRAIASTSSGSRLSLLIQALRRGVETTRGLEVAEEHVGGRVTRGCQITVALQVVRALRGELIEPTLIRQSLPL